MRRFVIVILACVSLLSASILPMKMTYAKNSFTYLPLAPNDAAVFYLKPHQLTATLDKPALTLDSKTFKAAPLLKKNGNLYFSLKWLETAHLATVKYDTKTGSYWAEFKAENRSGFSGVRLKPNQSKTYVESNGSLEALDDTIPAPFMKAGQLYVPVKLLPRMGINYTWSKGVMIWKWNDKIIKVMHPTYSTQDETITFSALVQKEFGYAYLLQSLGDGAWTSVINGAISTKGTQKTIDNSISIGGKEFTRIEFSVGLRPGENPLQIYTNHMGSAEILVHRDVSDPSTIPIRYNHNENQKQISFTKPTQGYFRVQAGEPIEIAGTVTDEQIESKQVSFQVSKFKNNDYYQVGKKTVVQLNPNQEFSGSVVIQEPGTYLIDILSPDVFIGGSSPYGSLKWAEIAVEVLPKISK